MTRWSGNELADWKLDWTTRRKSTFFYLYLWIFTHRALQGTTGATYRPHVYVFQSTFCLQTRARYFRLEVCSIAAHLETSDLFREIKFRWVIILVRNLKAAEKHLRRYHQDISDSLKFFFDNVWLAWCHCFPSTVLFRRPHRGYWGFIREITHRINRWRLSHLKWTKNWFISRKITMI